VGGPISDWPRGNSDKGGDDESSAVEDDDGTGGAADGDDESSPGDDSSPITPPRGTGSAKDAGKAAAVDAGAATGGNLDAGVIGGQVPGAESQSDGGLTDGGATDATFGDASIEPLPGPTCTMTSDARAAGGCYGSYCDVAQSSFMSAEPSGACRSDEERSLACDGEISRVVAECAQRDALAIGLGRSVAACAERTTSLESVGDACLDCYVDEIVCSLRSCLVACLDGSSAACSECRASRCGPAFLDCSGLPTPARAVSGLGVDGGVRRF